MKRLAVVLLLAACSSTTIDTSGYDTACNNDGDCAAVFQGDACTPCLCPNAGVASDAAAKYASDLAALRAKCGPMPAIGCEACAPQVGLCVSNGCSSRPE